MGAVSTETLHKCIKAYLDQMGTTVVIKVCAVCGEQLFGESFHPARPLSELEPLCLKAMHSFAYHITFSQYVVFTLTLLQAIQNIFTCTLTMFVFMASM